MPKKQMELKGWKRGDVVSKVYTQTILYIISYIIYIYIYILSKEVLKLNFRQYGQMKSRAGKRQREEKD